MDQPLVCAVMLTKDRPEMTARAVECFKRQSYALKSLLIYDTSTKLPQGLMESGSILHFYRGSVGSGIGGLRNEAIEFALIGAQPKPIEIIITWDSDDWSHPRRIEEQVAFLQSSGADCVGYSHLLFWDELKCQIEVDTSQHGPDGVGCLGIVRSVGEAWLYTAAELNYAPGTSLCYWRKTWERKHFADDSKGEDLKFQQGLKVATEPLNVAEPRMIATVHGGNVNQFEYSRDIGTKMEYARAQQYDEWCKQMLEGK